MLLDWVELSIFFHFLVLECHGYQFPTLRFPFLPCVLAVLVVTPAWKYSFVRKSCYDAATYIHNNFYQSSLDLLRVKLILLTHPTIVNKQISCKIRLIMITL